MFLRTKSPLFFRLIYVPLLSETFFIAISLLLKLLDAFSAIQPAAEIANSLSSKPLGFITASFHKILYFYIEIISFKKKVAPFLCHIEIFL